MDNIEEAIVKEGVNYAALSNKTFLHLVEVSTAQASILKIDEKHPAFVCMQKVKVDFELFKSQLFREKVISHKKRFDAIRDNDYEYIVRMLDANSKHRDTAKQEAALQLLKVFRKIDKRLHRLAYSVQTQMLESVINIWSKPEYASCFKVLDLSDDFDQLIASAKAFREYQKKHIEQKNSGSKINNRDLRIRLQSNFVLWLSMLKGFAVLGDDDACATLLHRINFYIKQERSQLKAKQTRKQNRNPDN